MNTLIGIAAFFVAAAATPGPNNLIVLRTATRSGMAGSLSTIGGVVLGGLALLAVVAVGAGSLFATVSWLRPAIVVGGCIYLAWLGLSLMVRRSPGDGMPSSPRHGPGILGTGFTGLFAFQFLNPKGWLMLLTAVSAATATTTVGTFLELAALFAPISLGCLVVWALFGTALTVWLRQPMACLWFDRVAGGLLLGAATLLLFDIRP